MKDLSGSIYYSILKQFGAIALLSLFLITNTKAQTSSWDTLNQNGLEYYRSGNLEKTQEFWEKGLNQALKEFGKNDVSYAIACFNLSGLYKDLGYYSKSELLYIQAKEIFGDKLGKNDPSYIKTLTKLVNLYEAQGNYSKEEPLLVEIMELEANTDKESLSYAGTCNALGVLYMNLGYFKKAETLFLEAIEIRSRVEGKESIEYGILLGNLAGVYLKQGMYSNAEPLYLESKQIIFDVYGKENASYTNACDNLASLYLFQGNYDKAESLYLETKEIIEKTLGKNHPENATIYNNLGVLYSKLGNYPKATEFHLAAKQIRAKSIGEEHPLFAETCGNLAQVYLALGEYDEAEPMYLKAKAINAKIRGKYNLPNAVFCSDLGVLYLNQKEFAKAENLLLEAREIYSMVVGINHPGYATVCQNLAVLYIVQNKLSKAEPLFREVKNIQLEQIDKNFKTLSEKEQQLYYSSLNSYLEGYTSFALVYYQQNASITRDLYDLRLATKGLIFNSTQKTRQQVMNSKDTVLINKFELLNLKRDHLAWQFRLAPEEKQNQNINEAELNSEVNNLEKEIIQLAEKNDLLIAQGERLTWQDIKEKLNKGEAAVEVIRTIKSEFDKEIMYAALIITSNTKEYPELVMFESGSSLEGRGINYYRNCILHQIEDNESYDLFWKPVSEKLKGIKKVYFSPDGVYYQMNLETLKNPTSGSYLFNDLKIQVVGSTQDIVKPNKLSNSTKALIFGFPNYTGDETIGKIQPLPGTEIEVKSIDKLFKGSRFSSTLLIGKEANEKNLKGARNPKFLHIATHGFFLPDLNQDKNLDSNYSVVENPLLRSGLLLANCEANPISQKDEDGTLTAYEAMNLYLDQTDLVVLSACETGLGTIQNGEGVFGLQRAFQQAGAKSVIFSLWKVSDLATQLLMTIFYKEYLKTNNLDQSFIVAKNMVRKDYPQPYYWGSFIIVGK